MTSTLDETRMKMLGELAELGLVLARDLQQAALTAKELDEKVRLADAFHRVGRGVRQSLALHARLERDAQRTEREDDAGRPSPVEAKRVQRKAQLKSVVERLIWTEREKLDESPTTLRLRLAQMLAAEAETEDFLDLDAEAQVANLCRILGLIPPAVQDGGAGLALRPAGRSPAPNGGADFSSSA
ncbi:MAG: hypothetical protein E7812_17820 [Phenylobacterium sp.]|nr:MAG: hypothetical protein E7812_17820 [Phenylobacterium sp.]